MYRLAARLSPRPRCGGPLAANDIAADHGRQPGPYTLAGRTRGSSAATRAGSSTRARRSPRTATRVLADARDRGGIGGIALTHDHADHAEGIADLKAAAGTARRSARTRHAGRRPPRRRRHLRAADRRRHPRPRARPPRLRRRTARASPATPSSARAASSSRPTRARCAATSPPSSACARWTSRSSARATARSSSTRTPSSTSTSPTASTASGASCTRSTAACARPTNCSTAVWADAPAALRGAATVTLAAHLDKLDEEGRLPDGVERPQLSRLRAGLTGQVSIDDMSA